MAKKRVTGFFFEHGVLTKSVENAPIYWNMKYQPKIIKLSRGNDEELPKTLILDTKCWIIWTHIFFFQNRASSLFYLRYRLSCCKKSEKTNGGKYENFCYRRTEGRTEGQTELVTEDPPTGRAGPKNFHVITSGGLWGMWRQRVAGNKSTCSKS